MNERLPPELFTKGGRRRPLQLKKIKYLFPELWERVLSSTDDSLTEKVRYELYLRGLYTFKTCIGIDCENKVTNHLSGQFCSTQCSKNSPITREKIESACIKKYGSKSSLGNKDVRAKSKETCMIKYGAENGGWAEQAQTKIKNTCQERYGSNSPGAAEQVRNKINETILERFGGTSPFCNLSVRNKAEKTLFERYGVDHVWKDQKLKNLSGAIETITNKNSKIFDFEFLVDEAKVSSLYKSGGWKAIAKEIGYSTNAHSPTIKRLKEYGYTLKIRSAPEFEIKEFIESLGFTVMHNSRSIIKPLELDLYIPEKNLAIEFNGIYWHSSCDVEESKTQKHKHVRKTDLCRSKGIHLLHIFENEWAAKKEIWKSMIKSNLGVSDRQIIAEKCSIKNIDHIDSNNFFRDNHLEGSIPPTKAVGIYCEDELLMAAAFIEDSLIRVCCKLNTNVIGGLGKIFKFVDGRFFFVANKKYFNENDVDSKHVLLRETCPRIFDVSGRDKTTRFAWDCGDYIFLINDDLQ